MHDAWLGEVDSSTAETAEKLAKRRRLVQAQLETQKQADEPVADTATLLRAVVAALQPGEGVARALRRLSGGGLASSGAKAAGAGGKRKAGGAGAATVGGEGTGGGAGGADSGGAAAADGAAAARRQQFETLTEAADALLRTGRFDIYSEPYDKLCEEVAQLPGARAVPAAAADDDDDAAAAAAAAAGVDEQTHAGMRASGFAFVGAQGVYYSQSSGLFYDPRSSLYWPAAGGGVYYYYDHASGQFVPATPTDADAPSAPAGAAGAEGAA